MKLRITDEMIETAAQAIHAQCCNRGGRGRSWCAIPEALRTSFRDEAKQALEAAAPLIKAA